jgi:ACS family hexuronate transporter-like MFS transporter
MLGFGEGATFPGGMRTVVQTLKPEQRSRGIAVAYSGGSLGAVITPVIITPIAAMWGWRGAFWATGMVGAAWLLLWAVLSRREDIAKPARVASLRSGRTGAPNFADPRVWAYIAAYALGALPSGFVLYQAALYLTAIFGKSQVEVGQVLWIPPLGWEIGYFFWGWATDRFSAGGASIPAMRRQFLAMMLSLSACLAVIPQVHSYRATLALMFLAMFIVAGFIIGAVAYATHHFSTDHAGFIAGLGAGSWSLAVALVMPQVGKLFDLHRYDLAFVLAALSPVAGCFLWILCSRRRVESEARVFAD